MRNVNDLVPGQIVKSKAGRDKGYVFFVLGILDEDHVLIADGDRRKIENPKKKKIRHLQPYSAVSSAVAEKLERGERIENIELQRELEKSGAIALTMEN